MPLKCQPFTPQQGQTYLHRLQQGRPLVHCLTNDVVQNFTANILLAIGASPAMVTAQEEIAYFVPICQALLINIGTVTHTQAESMRLAVKTAQHTGVPWVLDPVAVSAALPFRTQLAQELLTQNPTVIRGNAAEIRYLSGENITARGADSLENSASALPAAVTLAQTYTTCVAVTGQVDYVTDGQLTYAIPGGSPLLPRITGTGCALSALVAACLSATVSPLQAAATACLIMKHAAERADQAQGTGTFAVSLIDQLSHFAF